MILSPRDAQLFAAATLTPAILEAVVPIRGELLSDDLLRDYQLWMLLEAARLMRLGYRRILLQLPTGGGKTVMACQMLSSAQALGFPAQFIVHRKELIEQTSKTFTRAGIAHGFIASGQPLSPDALTILAGVKTLANQLGITFPPNLVVLDEAHHATATTWAEILDAYGDSFVIGLTATPERLDGRGLAEHFDIMVRGPTVAELIERGFLSQYDYYGPLRPAEEAMDVPELIGDVVSQYLKVAAGKQGIVFASSRKHSRDLAAAFRAAGVRAEHVDGEMSTKERERIDTAFRAGEIDILTNVDLFGEGYDVPGIVYVGLARRTKSLSLFLQMVGRALRVAPGKLRAIICDHANNVWTHGFPDDDREWVLEARTGHRRTGVNDDADPVRQCMSCFRVWPSTMKVCTDCDTPFGASPREIRIREGELQKLDREMARAATAQAKKEAAALRKREEKACSGYPDFYALAVARGYPEPKKWASMRMSFKRNYPARFGR